jgi:predicted neutral ceramidase superfamily lipid hydrolase
MKLDKSMRQFPLLIAIYLTVLAIFIAVIRFPVRLSLVLAIVGFVSFVVSFLPADEPELSSGDGSEGEFSSDTSSRWR